MLCTMHQQSGGCRMAVSRESWLRADGGGWVIKHLQPGGAGGGGGT